MTGKLTDYKKNIHSQNGEDGIIEEILKRLNITEHGTFCEFGAWDGIYLSNTFALVEKGWSGVYIESEKERYKDLLATAYKYWPWIETINALVEIQGDNSLDELLVHKSTVLPKDFDLLSIDIDSYDYQIWESLKKFNPKIVIIEVNSSIAPPKEQTHCSTHQGSSFSSTLKLGNEKGYDLVCHTGNMIFVRKDLTKDLFANINSNDLFDSRFVGH